MCRKSLKYTCLYNVGENFVKVFLEEIPVEIYVGAADRFPGESASEISRKIFKILQLHVVWGLSWTSKDVDYPLQKDKLG